jgi:hypothetical protein
MSDPKMKAADRAADKATGVMSDEDRYRMEDGMRTMMRAEEVKKDKKMMGRIAEHAGKVAKAAKKCMK